MLHSYRELLQSPRQMLRYQANVLRVASTGAFSSTPTAGTDAFN